MCYDLLRFSPCFEICAFLLAKAGQECQFFPPFHSRATALCTSTHQQQSNWLAKPDLQQLPPSAQRLQASGVLHQKGPHKDTSRFWIKQALSSRLPSQKGLGREGAPNNQPKYLHTTQTQQVPSNNKPTDRPDQPPK